MSINKILKIGTLFASSSILASFGNFVFRLYAVSMPSDEYKIFALIARTMEFMIVFFGFQLHAPMTQKLLISSDKGKIMIIKGFMKNYFVAVSLGTVVILILFEVQEIREYLTISNFTTNQIFLIYVLILLGMFMWSFNEFALGLTRGYNLIKKASYLTFSTGLIRGGISILLVISFLSISFLKIIGIYSISLIITSLLGLVYIYPYIKSIKQSKSLGNQEITQNFRDAGNLFTSSFVEAGLIWGMTFTAALLLDSNTFKIFDIALIIISMTGIITSNLRLAIIQEYTTKKVISMRASSGKKFKLIILFGTIITVLIWLIISLTKIDQIILLSYGIDIEIEVLYILRIFLFLPISMLISSISIGLLQAQAKYLEITKNIIVSLPLVAFLFFIIYYFNLPILLPIPLILNKLVFTFLFLKKSD